MWTCKHCNKEFDFTRTTYKANHSRHCDSNPKKQESYKLLKIKLAERIDKDFGPLTNYDVTCHTCNTDFIVEERSKSYPRKEKYFCSRSCANSTGGTARAIKHFPDEVAHYTTVCYRHHEKRCIVCGEDNIVSVHHNDHNHKNNDPKNLVPLCPTHHQYIHSRYRDEVQPIIDKYIEHTGVPDGPDL